MSGSTRTAKANLRLNVRDAEGILKDQHTDFDKPLSAGGGNLSPNLQPATPPTYLNHPQPSIVGNKYVLLAHLEGSTLRRCINIETKTEYVCKIVPSEKQQEVMGAHFRVDQHPHVNNVEEVLVGQTCTYVIFRQCHGDLHTYVRTKRNLREREALPLFRQVASAVAACHAAGIVLRDLKLRKFVFKDKEKTQLKLETLDDAVLLDEDDDWLNDKHGCPAYVSPEILSPASNYSGRAADCWSLGVVLYTMLVGRYPFHDTEPSGLFLKIRRGCYNLPEHLSSKARCLIRSLLRMDPSERLTADEVLDHPWFRSSKFADDLPGSSDQMVPDAELRAEEDTPFM